MMESHSLFARCRRTSVLNNNTCDPLLTSRFRSVSMEVAWVWPASRLELTKDDNIPGSNKLTYNKYRLYRFNVIFFGHSFLLKKEINLKEKI